MRPCAVLDALETRVGEDPNKDYETDVKHVAATAYAGMSGGYAPVKREKRF